MSNTSAYLRNPFYLALTDSEAQTIATVISGNGKVLPPDGFRSIDFRYMEKPEYRNTIKVKRAASNDTLYFYHIVVTEPISRYKASYEMVACENVGCVLRYRGMRPRIFTHFGLNVTRELEMNKTHNMAKFLSLLEEIKNAPYF